MTPALTELSLAAPAKLNLFLQITGQRADGYHQLQSLFQFIDLHDTLHLRLRQDGQILFQSQLQLDDPQETNLVVRAAEALKAAVPMAKRAQLGVDLQLDKRLPLGGGVGGGSSDAASTLLGLNHLWQLGHSLQQLAAIGLQLGADVPVFIWGHSAWAEGIGEELTPCSPPTPQYLLLSVGRHCHTGRMFAESDLERNSPPCQAEEALQQLGYNAFEPIARRLYPDIELAFQWCQRHQLQPALTGSGALIYAPLAEPALGPQLQQAFLNAFPKAQAWITQGQNRSLAHQQLAALSGSSAQAITR